MYLNVPGARAVDANIRAREKIGHYLFGSVHNDLAEGERFVLSEESRPLRKVKVRSKKEEVRRPLTDF